ncbi:pirin family protein [Pontibacter sp. 13R65]|uniref:pirin family protein n=1 Tax=Pontibacter sp. 13R65 TaxID=3127458 RepID=UPI00301B9E13
MKKKISFSAQGQRADIGEMIIYRILPNRYADAVGPFVFLDHFAPIKDSPDQSRTKQGTGAHPHRGIATLTYVLKGEGEHFDSQGNHAKVYSGGIQWMKAGNGILHDERAIPDTQTGDPYMHGFQFWINLPSQVKKENPEYLTVDANEVPIANLEDNRGWLKVIVGQYKNLVSKIPTYTKQFLYHIQVNAGKTVSFPAEKGMEYAIFLPQHHATVNNTSFHAGDFIAFDTQEGTIEITNAPDTAADILLFGGEPYTEPIVAHGPFVMNSLLEIAEAYQDFHANKYGKINYQAEEHKNN